MIIIKMHLQTDNNITIFHSMLKFVHMNDDSTDYNLLNLYFKIIRTD